MNTLNRQRGMSRNHGETPEPSRPTKSPEIWDHRCLPLPWDRPLYRLVAHTVRLHQTPRLTLPHLSRLLVLHE